MPLSYSGSVIFKSVLGSVAGIITLRLVNPQDMGYWKAALTIVAYASILQGGIIQGINRELPYKVASANDSRELNLLISTAQSFVLFITILTILAAIMNVIFNPFDLGLKLKYSFSVVLLNIGLSFYTNFLTVTYRAYSKFEAISLLNIITSLLDFFSIIFVLLFGFWGILQRYALVSVIRLLLFFRLRPVRNFTFKINFRILFDLLSVGFPLFLSGYIIQRSYNFPNLIILLNGGVKYVGLFAPAATVSQFFAMISLSGGQYIYTNMNLLLGRTNNPFSVWKYTLSVTFKVAAIMLPLTLIGVILIPYFIKFLFPKYLESTRAAQFMALAGFFWGMQFFSLTLNSLKAWKWIATYTILRTIFAFGIPYSLLIFIPKNILTVTAIGYLLASIMTFMSGLLITKFAIRNIANREK